jgi:amphi-Trp domain-containing protein
MDTSKFHFSASVGALDAADYLYRIADGLRQGGVAFAAADRSIWLQPGELARLELSAESKGDRGSIELEISWKTREIVRPPTLEITAGPRREPVATADDEDANETLASDVDA